MPFRSHCTWPSVYNTTYDFDTPRAMLLMLVCGFEDLRNWLTALGRFLYPIPVGESVSSLGRICSQKQSMSQCQIQNLSCCFAALSVSTRSPAAPFMLIGSKTAKLKDFAKPIVFVTSGEQMRLDSRILPAALARWVLFGPKMTSKSSCESSLGAMRGRNGPSRGNPKSLGESTEVGIQGLMRTEQARRC